MTTGTPGLHPIPAKSPWYHIGIDFVGPILPPGDDGSRYNITMPDYFISLHEDGVATCNYT